MGDFRDTLRNFTLGDLGDFGEHEAKKFEDLKASVLNAWERHNGTRDAEYEFPIPFVRTILGGSMRSRFKLRDGSIKDLEVKVPAGIDSGAKLRLGGQAGGSPPADIILQIKVLPDPRYQREGKNIRMTQQVTALQAVRGGPVDVHAPAGTLTLKLPPGSQNGQTFRLKGKGIAGAEPGDLLVTLDVRLPTAPDPELVRVLERLQGSA